MKRIKLVLLLTLGGLVSACANTNITSRNAPFEEIPLSEVTEQAPEIQQNVLRVPITDARVESITVIVPDSLTVSEANRYLPGSDIVWREDPIGDRHAQVQQIFETAMERGTAPMDGTVPVAVEIEVTRFHALTEKARYVTGGVHSITFILTLRDPATGNLWVEPREVRADLIGLGGNVALQAEARGQTQKVRITDHLAEVIRLELTTPEGFKNPNLGFLQVMNQI